MYRLLLACLALFFSHTLHAAELRDYQARQIAPHTYFIEGPIGYPSVENQGFMNNPAFIVTTYGVVVIDPGSSVQSGRMVLRQIRKVTNNPVTHVFNTHIHGDHWLGNEAMAEAFPKAVILAHPDMIKLAQNGANAEWLALMDRSTAGFTRGTRAVIPTTAVNDGDVIRTDGLTLRIHAPADAHSHSDIMIEADEESVVFTGDNVLNQRIARMDDATFAGNIAACDVAAAIKARIFVPGHGPAGGVEIVQNFRNYLATLYDTVKTLRAQGLQDFEMKPAVVAKLGPYQSWPGFADEVGRHINLATVELDNAF